MKTTDDLLGVQHRAMFRTSLTPNEIEIRRLWIHDPGVRFADHPSGPDPYVLLLEKGARLLNISAGGTLVHVSMPAEVALLRLIAAQDVQGVQGVSDPSRAERQAAVPFRDVSMVLRIDLRRDLRDILVSGSIIRATILRTTTALIHYELAVRFDSWGKLVGSTTRWCKVRGGSVPPVAAWITRRQLNKAW